MSEQLITITIDPSRIQAKIDSLSREIERLRGLLESIASLREFSPPPVPADELLLLVDEDDGRGRGRPQKTNPAYAPIRELANSADSGFTSIDVKRVAEGIDRSLVFGAIRQLEAEGIIQTVTPAVGRRVGFYRRRD